MIEELFKTIREGSAHQSVLIEGDVPALVAACVAACQSASAGVTLYPITADVWTIDHSRMVSAAASRTTDGPLCILLAGNVFTIESQHALLKVTEEALPKIFFIIITGSADILLATLRSRCTLIKVPTQEKKETFLNLSIPERLTAVASAIESPEHRKAYALLKQLSHRLARSTTREVGESRTRAHLSRIYTLLSKHPIGMKSLLEHLALTLPIDK